MELQFESENYDECCDLRWIKGETEN